MGCYVGWSSPSSFYPNGLLPSEATSITQYLDPDRWSMAEERTAQLITCIQPNKSSEEHRNAVASYVKRLITRCFSCQVFTFGSVPLKTYLPDGDIDLTAFEKNETLKDTWANDLREMLESEEKSEDAEFCVKEVQYIQAEVKIIKCLVDNIVVDISFNQLGGLCTLCFLEEVDSLISQNHLFKRSIILIKAWCYYESRVLGAHHGLISTYALETLVLYIFHVINNTFSGPLEVLYRFLEFFGKFDWDNYCVSLWGPVPLSSLPDMTADPPRKDGGELLLSKVFLDACGSVYSNGQENYDTPFISKHFNIIDPLRMNNNLGRSVSKGNFFRIRSAFAFGAQRLARLLNCPKENISAEINQFFKNTLNRHGKGHRPDVYGLQPVIMNNNNGHSSLRNSSSSKNVKENSANHASEVEMAHASHGILSRPANQFLKHVTRSNDVSSVSHTRSQKPCMNLTSSVGSGHNHQMAHSSPNENASTSEGSCGPDFMRNGMHGGHPLVRTTSSHELTDTSSQVSSRTRHNKTSEIMKGQNATKLSYGRRSNLDTEMSGKNNAMSLIEGQPPSRKMSSQQQIHVTIESNGASNISDSESGLGPKGEEKPSVAEGIWMQHEEQDLMNMIASSSLHTLSGHVPLPDLDSLDNGNFQAAQFEDQKQFSSIGYSSPASPVSSVENYSTKACGSLKGNREFVRESFVAHPHHWHVKGGGAYSANARSVPTSLAMSKIIQSSEASLDGSSSRISRSTGDKCERKSGHSSGCSAIDENGWQYESELVNGISTKTDENGWQYESELVNGISTKTDDKSGEWVPPSKVGTEVVEGTVSSSLVQNCHEARLLRGPNSMLPIVPLLVNSGSVAFYPTGPPVPFVTMLPFCSFPAEKGSSDSSIGHLDCGEGLKNPCSNKSDQRLDSTENLDDSDMSHCPSSAEGIISAEPSEEHKSDILNSDFASHWQNLQYGRILQDPVDHGPILYPSVVVPPMYMQDDFPQDSPGRPLSVNANLFSQLMGYGPRITPGSNFQPSTNRPLGTHGQCGDRVPRCRGGTGTYLPNPVPLRDRHSLSGRNRGNYNSDWNDRHGDREGHWNMNSKQRFSNRGRGRNQFEKTNTRMDRTKASNSCSDRPWNAFSSSSFSLSQSQNSLNHTNSMPPGSANVAYGMYPLQVVNPDGVSAGNAVHPVYMLYPYGENMAHGSAEQLEFGSLGPVQLGEGSLKNFNGQQYFQVGSSQSSPNKPSSPKL
ncbi:Polynucleotide adenylyltransferase [Bertholletia excelsa]